MNLPIKSRIRLPISPPREIFAGLGLVLGAYGIGGLAFRLLVISDYTMDLGWEDFLVDVTISGVLIAAGAIAFGFSLRRRS